MVLGYLTVIAVCSLMSIMVVHGRYWTWEKIALFLCVIYPLLGILLIGFTLGGSAE